MAMTDMTDIGQQGCSLPDQAGKLQEVMALIAFLRRKYIRPLKCIVGPWLASVALLSGFAAPAAAEVLVSNLGQGNDLDHYPITNIIDQKFTTGNNRRGYDVESVTLRFKGNVPTNQGAFQLEIREGSASLADRICALGNPASLDAGDRTFSASSCPNLDKDESYYLTIVTSHHAKLVRVSSNNEDAGKASGWSINNNSKTLTQGSHSQLHSQSLKFRMEGEIINTLPTAADGLVQATEDMAYPFAAADFNFSDLDSNDDSNDLLDHVTIITLPTEGTLALNGVAVMAGDEVTKQSLDDDHLTYTPPANVNGVDIASFTFKVNDGKDDSESAYSMNINVTAVNDAPTASPKTVTATEDTDYPFTATDFSFMDIDQGDTLNHVTITTVPGTGKGELLLDGAVIAMSDLDKDVTAGELGDSKLKYRPPTDENGDNYASFSFTVNDGEDDSESAYSMNINVTAVNDPPIPMDDDAETPENTPVEIEVLANDEDVDEGTALSVTRVGTADGIDTATETNPANGTVTITGSGTTITYTPDSNFITGTDTFTYVVSDNATSPLTPLTAVGTVTVTVISDASNARLSGLTMSRGTLEPDFSASTTSYTASVANSVDSISLTPTTERTGARVTVNGTAVTRGSASAAIPLAEGVVTSIPVVVTPQDRNAEKRTYTINVTRVSANADLSNLALSTGTLKPDFSAANTSYIASVANDVASLTLTAAASHDNARLTLTVDGKDVESTGSSASADIDLREGETTKISIKVTAQDGTTTQTYSIEVSRAPSDNAALSYLQLSKGTLAPLFAPHITSYSASVGNDVTSLTVTPSTSNDNATVTVNGNEVIRGSASDAIPLALGNNTIPVVVTAQDGTTTQSYSITVTRAAADASDVATLSALSLSPESLNETFVSSTTSYTANVLNSVASVTLTAAATNDNARLTLTVNDEDVESTGSSASADIDLREGETTRIRIKVTAQDGETTQTYSIEVSRAPSDNAALSHLQLSEGTLAPLFAPHITSYSASVGNDVASLTVTPSTSNENATVTVNGNEVTSDNPSDAISLALGNNTIPVVVTAQDGTTTQSYSITVTRAAADASDVATLSALSLSPESLNETFVSSTTSYTANVLNSVASVTLTAAATNDNARLTLTVNDEDVESTGSSASADIDLREGETTRIRIKVTAQDGETTQTYSIEVSRAPSDNAALSHLQLSEGTLAPLFAPHITSYSASVGNDVASLTVTPSTSNENATVTVNGNEVTSDNPSDAISLALGNNTIPVVVTAQDGTTTQSYSITVTRAAATASSDATLASLSLSPESLNETFASSTTSYTASVANDVASVTLTAAATNDNARLTLTVNDEDVESSSSGSASADIDLREGEITRIRIKVTAEDGTTTQTYNIEVSRAASDNAALSYLQLSAGTLAPLFDPHTTSYSASVANAVERMTLTPTTANENATVTVDDVAVSSGNASADIALSEGENSISVVVTAQDGTTTQSYSITVTRAAATASNDATLNSLSLSQGTLNETFASDTTSYTAEVLNSVASLTLTAAATDNNARLTLTVNDEDVESSSSGSASADIDLREGEITRISIKVTAEDGTTTQTYSIEVSRAASDNAALSYLQLSAGTLAPLFDPHTTSYSASVANAVERMTLTPTTANENATVTVDDVAVSSGNASADIALSEGENSISVVVTAQDGTTTQSYSITVTRAAATASSDATLASLSLSQGSLNETFASDTTSYTAEVLNSVASVTLTAAATDNNARLTLTVNDEDVESSSSNSANRNIPLREGETTRIRIKVTAQDGETTQTYNIEVSRAPSDNAALSHLQLSEGTLAPLFAPHITSYSASVGNDVASLTVTPSTSNENATVTVNGNEVIRGSASDAISLALGNNTIPVVVTAQDGTTTQSYSITVTRAAADASDVATLSALSLSPESLNETFASSTTSYTASVANDVASVTLTAAATNDNARLTLTVDDEDVESSSSSSANRNIPLREGETTRIRIKVTAQDGETTQTYSIEVSRAPSDNAALSHLQLSEGTLAPLFAPHITSYSASVGNDVASLTVTPSTSNDNATVTINGNEVTSDNPSDAISLALGNNTIPVVVTAQDGTTTQSYSITVTRAAADASDVATLSALSLSPESLNETFASSTTSYSASVANDVASVTLTAAATNDNARLTLTVNDEEVESSSSNSANRNIPLREGETTRIRIKVTAQDGETTQTYSIEVSRAPSDNAALSHLQLSEGTLAPLFAPHITSYSASVGNDVASLTVTPSTSNDNATVTVNGNEVTSDSASDAISLALGNNTIPVVVTAQDGTTTQSYSITVTRAAVNASDVATLSALSLSPESLNETFASSTTSYTVSVANDVASVTLTAAATNDNARLTLTVDDEDVESSSSSSANRNIPLREGETTRIRIKVTA